MLSPDCSLVHHIHTQEGLQVEVLGVVLDLDLLRSLLVFDSCVRLCPDSLLCLILFHTHVHREVSVWREREIVR